MTHAPGGAAVKKGEERIGDAIWLDNLDAHVGLGIIERISRQPGDVEGGLDFSKDIGSPGNRGKNKTKQQGRKSEQDHGGQDHESVLTRTYRVRVECSTAEIVFR